MRYFKFIGDPENYPETDLLVKGGVYSKKEAELLHEKFSPCMIMIDGPTFENDFIDVTSDFKEEQKFINQCAISAMKTFISSPERFPKALDLVNIPALAFNVAEEMNEERKKRLKKSSS